MKIGARRLKRPWERTASNLPGGNRQATQRPDVPVPPLFAPTHRGGGISAVLSWKSGSVVRFVSAPSPSRLRSLVVPRARCPPSSFEYSHGAGPRHQGRTVRRRTEPLPRADGPAAPSPTGEQVLRDKIEREVISPRVVKINKADERRARPWRLHRGPPKIGDSPARWLPRKEPPTNRIPNRGTGQPRAFSNQDPAQAFLLQFAL